MDGKIITKQVTKKDTMKDTWPATVKGDSNV
jgi:hypothetical protein